MSFQFFFYAPDLVIQFYPSLGCSGGSGSGAGPPAHKITTVNNWHQYTLLDKPQEREVITMSINDDVYFSFQEEAIRKILGKLLEKAKAFLNPDYGLKKCVENETDFLLGVTLAQILDHMGWLIHTSKTPEPTGKTILQI